MTIGPQIYKLIMCVGIAGFLAILLAYEFPLFSLTQPGVWSNWWEINSMYILIFIPFLVIVTAGASFFLKSLSNQSLKNLRLVVDMNNKQITTDNTTMSIRNDLYMEVVANGDSPKAILLHNKNEQLEIGMINPQTMFYVPALVMQLVIEDFQTMYQIPANKQ